MITINPEYLRKLGDLPKEEFIPNAKLELYITFANNDFSDEFPEFDYTDDLIVSMATELKGRFALIHAIPFVNTMYVDGYAKYTESGVLENRFYSPADVNNLISINERRKNTLLSTINKRIATLNSLEKDEKIFIDKSGFSITVIGGEIAARKQY